MKTQYTFLTAKCTESFTNNYQMSTASFKDKDEVSPRDCTLNKYNCGGHTENAGCHTIFSTNKSSYVVAFDA